MVVTLLPQVIGFYFAHLALRMNPVLLLGALAGAQTVTAAMAAVQERWVALSQCWAIRRPMPSRIFS